MRNLIIGLCLAPAFALDLQAQTSTAAAKEAPVAAHAKGPFEVKTAPQDDKTGDILGRLIIEKQYHGDLAGAGKGQMLTAGSVASGSAAYVAIERVTGTLKGRAGSLPFSTAAR
jgi:hypothetical protein